MPEPARSGTHSRQRSGPRSSGQPEQHCLGLVVKGVAKQHGATTGMLQQGGSPGSTGSSLRAVRITGVDVHRHDDGWHVVTGKLGASLLGDLV